MSSSLQKRQVIFFSAAAALLLLSFLADPFVHSFFTPSFGSWGREVMRWISYFGNGLQLAIASVVLLAIALLLERAGLWEAGMLAVSSLIVSAIAAQTAKALIGRARPRLMQRILSLSDPSPARGLPGFDSFPSGHTTSSFALAVILAHFYPKGRAFFYAAASAVAFSRIYLGLHFLSDVLGGVLVGSLSGYLVIRYAGRILQFVKKTEERPRALWSIIVISTLGGLLSFHQLGDSLLFDGSEAAFAETARRMLQGGEFTVSMNAADGLFGGSILFKWLTALSLGLFGANEFAARFWPALAATGLTAIIYLFGKLALGPRPALTSSLILLTNIPMMLLAHLAIPDMLFTFFITASICTFYLALQDASPSRAGSWALGAWAAAAAATLTEGLTGFLIPSLVVLLFLSFSGGFARARALLIPRAAIGFLFACAIVWIASTIFGGIGNSAGPGFGRADSWIIYLVTLGWGFFPWSVFLPAAIASARNKHPGPGDDRAREDFLRFLLTWLLVILFFYTFSETKLPNIAAPMVPALSLLLGWWWNRCLSGEESPDRLRFSAAWGLIFGSILTAVIAALPLLLGRLELSFLSYSNPPGRWELESQPFLLAATAASATAGFFLLFKKRSARHGFVIIFVSMVLFSLVLFRGFLPRVSQEMKNPVYGLVRAAYRLDPQPRLVLVGKKSASVLFYSKRPVIFMEEGSTAELKELLGRRELLLLIAKIPLASGLQKELGLSLVEERGGYALLSNR